jgi:hypothetical protein
MKNIPTKKIINTINEFIDTLPDLYLDEYESNTFNYSDESKKSYDNDAKSFLRGISQNLTIAVVLNDQSTSPNLFKRMYNFVSLSKSYLRTSFDNVDRTNMFEIFGALLSEWIQRPSLQVERDIHDIISKISIQYTFERSMNRILSLE